MISVSMSTRLYAMHLQDIAEARRIPIDEILNQAVDPIIRLRDYAADTIVLEPL